MNCAKLVAFTAVAGALSVRAGDGLDKQYEVFSPANGYLPAVVADGGGLGKDLATKGCFVAPIWLSGVQTNAAASGLNYFQNGIDSGTVVYGGQFKHNVLFAPDVSSLSAAAAAPYLTFPGNKLVLGTGEKGGLDPMYFYLNNGSNGLGNLSTATAKPYYFGGDGLVMAGHCSLYLNNRHCAIAGKLTILSDDHDDYRQSKGATLTCNIERWTMNQCSLVRLQDSSSYHSIDIQSTLIGAANAFLCVMRHGTAVDAGTTYHSTCRISGDNAQYLGTIAVETNCWLQLKTSLANATVKVGYRGWPEYRSGAAGNAPYDKLDFDPSLNLAGHFVTEANAGALTVGTLDNNCGDVTVSTGTTLSVGSLTYKGGDFTLALDASAANCGTLAATAFAATHRPIRIRLAGTDVPTVKTAVFTVPSSAGLTAADFAVTGTGADLVTVETSAGLTKVMVGGAVTVHQSANKSPGLGDGDDCVNTFMFASDCWTPAGAPEAGKRYVNDQGRTAGGPRLYNNTGDIPAASRTFAGDAYVLGKAYSDGYDTTPSRSCLYFMNGWGFDGSDKRYDVESRPYVFGGDGLVLMNYAYLQLGRFGAVQGKLTVLGDDAMAYARAGNEDRQWDAVPVIESVANGAHPWGFAHDGELIGAANAFLCFRKSAGTPCSQVSEIRFTGNTDGYHGRIAVETNCVLRLKTGLRNGGVIVGWRGWPVKKLDWNLPYAPETDVAGKVLFPADRGALAVGSISNNCGAVTVEAGTSVTAGDFVYNGGIIHLGSTAAAAGALAVTNRFAALRTPVYVKFDAATRPGEKTAVLSVPAASGLTADDFSFSGLGSDNRLVAETKDGALVFSTVGIVAFAAGTQEVVSDYAFDAIGYTFGISSTVGGSASLTVTGTLSAPTRPIRIGLTGNGNAMPQGELVKLVSWTTAGNPTLDICDFDFSLLGEHDNFGPGGIGRGYPVLKTEGAMTTLCLDCTEVLKNAADTGYTADKTCFLNGDKWADGQMPHLDANYFANGKLSYAPMDLSATNFPDGLLVPGREFHGNRIRVGSGTELLIEKAGKAVNFAQEGLVLQQGGQLHFCDPNIVVSGKVHCASLYGGWTMSAESSRTGCENASSVGDTSSRFTADFTADRRADFTVFATSWFGTTAKSVGKHYTCTFDGNMDGFLGTLVCENRCRLALNRDLPNGTVKLGWTGLPFAALGSIDGCTNGWLAASCADRTLSISNLVVNGAKVTVADGNTYALKELTLNGGTIDVSAFGSTATQLAVDGPVAVTHATKIALTRRPLARTPLKILSWPTAQPTPDTALLTLVRADGSSWGEKCALMTETEGDVTYLTACSPATGAVIIFR